MSVHEQQFVEIPKKWENNELNEKWEKTDNYTELITCVETQKIVKEAVQFGI